MLLSRGEAGTFLSSFELYVECGSQNESAAALEGRGFRAKMSVETLVHPLRIIAVLIIISREQLVASKKHNRTVISGYMVRLRTLLRGKLFLNQERKKNLDSNSIVFTRKTFVTNSTVHSSYEASPPGSATSP